MNWGKGIITGMIIFMLFIIGMGIRMFMMPADDYDHNYYEKGLSFNQDYNAERQVSTNHAQPIITQTNEQLILKFTSPVTGKIQFQRMSNQALDKTFALKSNTDNTVFIPIDAISKGKWQLVLRWQSHSKNYLYQQQIFVK